MPFLRRRGSWRAMYMSSLFFGKETARYSASIATAVFMSSMSLAVSAGAVRPPPMRLMPLLFDRAPPTSTRVAIAVPRTDSTRADQPVVEQQDDAGCDVVGQLLVIEADAFLVAQVPRGVERELLARLEHNLAGGELADADLRPCRSAMIATSRPNDRAESRTMRARSSWSAAVPCEKFSRTTSTPAASIRVSTSTELLAGPSVATILVERCIEGLA
jgi:hypothetical protein